MAAPLFILAPGRSFTSIVCAMLGQHPQMYGLPELNLCITETMRQWWIIHRRGKAVWAHGLLRAVAQLYFGGQTEETIELARWWVWRRLSWNTSSMFRHVAEKIDPLMLVKKSPITVSQPAYLQRLLTTFPQAKFIHLLRHPRSNCESMLAMPRSPFTGFGPPGARFGNDPSFLKNHAIRPHGDSRRLEDRVKPQSLEGPLNWREDGAGFSPKVKQLAREFGYT